MARFDDSPEFSSGQIEERLVHLDEESYKKDCALLRADVNTVLGRHGALLDKDGWALFMVPLEADPDGGLPLDPDSDTPGSKEILLINMHHNLGLAEDQPPNVRILTNEPIRNIHGTDWIATDFGLDIDNDCLVIIAGLESSEERALKRKGETVGSIATIFMVVEENSLRFSQSFCADFPPSFNVVETIDGRKVETAPLGVYDNLTDKRHALAAAQELVRLVMDHEPVFTLNGSDSQG